MLRYVNFCTLYLYLSADFMPLSADFLPRVKLCILNRECVLLPLAV